MYVHAEHAGTQQSGVTHAAGGPTPTPAQRKRQRAHSTPAPGPMVMNMPYSPRLAIFSRSSDSYAQRKDPLDMLPIARSELRECRMACFESPSEYMTQSSTFLPPEWTTQCAMSSLRSRCFASSRCTMPGILRPIR